MNIDRTRELENTIRQLTNEKNEAWQAAFNNAQKAHNLEKEYNNLLQENREAWQEAGRQSDRVRELDDALLAANEKLAKIASILNPTEEL